MKRYRIEDSEMLSIQNILHAIETSVACKQKKKPIHKKVLEDKYAYAVKIKEMLADESFTPSKLNHFKRTDPVNKKVRTIDSTPFYPDQIIHRLLIDLGQEYFMKAMSDQCCACVPGRGTHYGKKGIERWARTQKKKYFVKLDIRKYYPSVTQAVAEKAIKRKFKNCLWRRTFLKIILAYDSLPIGLLTSQWTANLILEQADHFVEEQLRPDCFKRYMDDVLLCAPNKRKLAKMAEVYTEYLKHNLGLTVKPNWCVHRFDYVDRKGKHCGTSLDMLGFRFYSTHTAIRRAVFKRLRRKCLRYHKRATTPKHARALLSGYSYFTHTDSQRAYKRYLQPHLKQAKGVVRHESRKQNSTSIN